MYKINIKTKENEINIKLGNITQLLGYNFAKKNQIITSLYKHFSSSKYAEYEEEMINNIKINGENVGREFFTCIKIQNREELINEMKIGKKTKFFEYLQTLIEKVEVQNNLQVIDAELIKIYETINNMISENIKDMKIDFDIENLLTIVSESNIVTEEEKDINYINNFNLLKNYIQILINLYESKSKRVIFIFENIDHYLLKKEYIEIIEFIKENNIRNIFFIFTISINNFVYIEKNELSYIIVLNDIDFQIPEYEKVKEFLRETYPINFDYDEENIYKIFSLCINEVGLKIDKYILKKEVIKKLFNKALMINDDKIFKLLDEENSFISL